MKRSALLISLGVHLILINIETDEKKKVIYKQKIKLSIKVKNKEKRVIKKRVLGKRKGISMKDLSIKFNTTKDISEYGSEILTSGSEFNRFKDQIEQHLQYPTWLVKRNIQGFVRGSIIISKKEIIGMTFKASSSSLKNYIIFVIKRSLNKEFLGLNSSGGRFLLPIVFHFKLSTGVDDKPHLLGDSLSFYRKAYGGDAPIDKINTGLTEALAVIQNPLTLLKHRPDWMKTDKERTKEMSQEKRERKKYVSP
ncbi:MAG: hypothetical protein KC493_12805 [Bacteriovoracaceae bacterium]|nr:hypothetical protein [Bacteriovoracaceae bacterium]